MTTTAKTVSEYLASVPSERVEAVQRLVDLARATLLPGYEESVGYVGINYVVPLARYPQGYHCTPGEPVPFITIASQAQYIAVYHMGLYAAPELLAWFQRAWAEAGVGKLDMGKSCIRLRKPDRVPFAVFEELFRRLPVDDWLRLYESTRPR